MERQVENELLDHLLPDDREAQESRHDLRKLNAIMSHAHLIERQLRFLSHPNSPKYLIEIGAGDGTFLLGLARRLAPRWRNVEVALIDRQSVVTEETLAQFESLGWTARLVPMDVFEWLSNNRGTNPQDTAIVANLFLHHFDDAELRKLLHGISAMAHTFVACEPQRSLFALTAARLVGLIGCNRITRHDAVVSVRSGFSNRELSSLWGPDSNWRLTEKRAGLFSHIFLAHLKSESA